MNEMLETKLAAILLEEDSQLLDEANKWVNTTSTVVLYEWTTKSGLSYEIEVCRRFKNITIYSDRKLKWGFISDSLEITESIINRINKL